MTPEFNFHTHSHYCDGSDHPERYVEEAISKGFHSLGFSSHAPVPFQNTFAIQSEEKLAEYCSTIRGLQEKYSGIIRLFLGLEIDHIPGLMPGFDAFRKTCRLDYTIGSVHLVSNGEGSRLWFIDGPRKETYDQGLKVTFGGDHRKAVTAYYEQIMEMVTEQRPDVAGHLDKVKMHNKGRYFSESDPWYRQLVYSTLETIKKQGTIVEVNTRGIYKKRSDSLFPSPWVLEKIAEMNIPVTISSDAHRPSELDGHYEQAGRAVLNAGIRNIMILGEDGWRPHRLEAGQGR